MKRGEVWWAEPASPASRRPVLLLSRNDAYLVRNLVLVAPITTRTRGLPSEVVLGKDDGMSRECAVNLEDMTTVPKDLLVERLCSLSARRLEEVEAAIHFAMGMVD